MLSNHLSSFGFHFLRVSADNCLRLASLSATELCRRNLTAREDQNLSVSGLPLSSSTHRHCLPLQLGGLLSLRIITDAACPTALSLSLGLQRLGRYGPWFSATIAKKVCINFIPFTFPPLDDEQLCIIYAGNYRPSPSGRWR